MIVMEALMVIVIGVITIILGAGVLHLIKIAWRWLRQVDKIKNLRKKNARLNKEITNLQKENSILRKEEKFLVMTRRRDNKY